MSAIVNKTTGVKGSDTYSSTGSRVLDLSVQLNRGLDANTINAEVDGILGTGDVSAMEDTYVLAFQTRDIRGGKGERDLFYNMWKALHRNQPSVAAATLDLIPEYGCWRDLVAMANNGPEVRKAIIELAVKQLNEDEAKVAADPAASISLLAKWLPREHSNTQTDIQLAREIARALKPDSRKANEEYRKRVAALNKHLKTLEITLCGGKWTDIEPAKVPGRALKQYTKALLNQPVKGEHGRKVPSTDPDRVACAENFALHFAKAAKGEAKVKGADTVYPHELVKKVLASGGYSYYSTNGHDSCTLSQEERDAIEAQWRAIVDKVKEGGQMNRTLAMCDFSGSMSGIPMNVSMALGLIIAECNTGVFKDTILTFDSTPTLHTFKSTGLVNRVNEVKHLAQGTSTDFQAAYNLLLTHLKENGVRPGDEPTDLIVLTDMGWDAATRSGQYSGYTGRRHTEAVKTKEHETHLQIARRAFALAGEVAWGEPFAPPRIIVWNLRAEYKDFHATADEEGVLNVAGWSPSLLRVLITRGINALTPEAMLRAQLDDPRYDAVRERVHPLLPKPTVETVVDSSLGSYFGC